MIFAGESVSAVVSHLVPNRADERLSTSPARATRRLSRLPPLEFMESRTRPSRTRKTPADFLLLAEENLARLIAGWGCGSR